MSYQSPFLTQFNHWLKKHGVLTSMPISFDFRWVFMVDPPLSTLLWSFKEFFLWIYEKLLRNVIPSFWLLIRPKLNNGLLHNLSKEFGLFVGPFCIFMANQKFYLILKMFRALICEKLMEKDEVFFSLRLIKSYQFMNANSFGK